MNTLKDMNVAVKMLHHDYKNMNVQSFYDRKSKLHASLTDFIQKQGGRVDVLQKLGKIALFGGLAVVAAGTGAEMLSGVFENSANISSQVTADAASKGAGMLKTGAGLLAGAVGLKFAGGSVERKIETAQVLRSQVDNYRDKMQNKELGNEGAEMKSGMSFSR